MMIFQCESCGLDSGYTEKDKKVKCRYCEEPTKMKLISKQPLTEEVMANRLKTITDRLFTNLQSAYNSLPDEERNLVSESGSDLESELLNMLGKAKKIKEDIEEFTSGKNTSNGGS